MSSWYVLKMRTSSSFARFRELLTEAKLEFFLPTTKNEVEQGACHTMRERPILFSYIFVHADEQAVAGFVQQNVGVTMLRHRSLSGEPDYYVSIPNRQMQMFVYTVGQYAGVDVPLITPSDEVLDKGDRVRVLDGPFHGVEGILEAQQGKEGGRVIVRISNVLAVPTLQLLPESIEVLEFSKQSRHLYQKLDAFEPRLRKVVDCILTNEPVPDDLSAHVALFVRRFSNLYVPSLNSRARYLGLLMLAYRVLDRHRDALTIFRELDTLIPTLRSKSSLALAQEMCSLYVSLSQHTAPSCPNMSPPPDCST